MPPRVRHQQRDTVILPLPDGREVQLLRVIDPRARHLRLLVSGRGPRLTVPPGTDPVQARQFLQRHVHWLADQISQDPAYVPHEALVPGQDTQLNLRGQRHALHWQKAPWLHINPSTDAITVALPEATPLPAIQRALHEFLLGQARADIGRWLPQYLPGLPQPPREWKLRPLASLWGSLNARRVLSLDLALILAPPAAFEYVLVHELCHLIHPNHSPAFWHEVEQRFPHWRSQRHWLHHNGLTTKRELQRLIGS